MLLDHIEIGRRGGVKVKKLIRGWKGCMLLLGRVTGCWRSRGVGKTSKERELSEELH